MTHNLHEQLKNFRMTHPYKELDVAGVSWKYIACGHSNEALLILPGVLGLGETAFQQIMAFEAFFRVISVTYPSKITTVTQLVSGLLAVLTAENINRVCVDGVSYGGMIAQCFVRHYPHKVEKLILSHSGAPRTRKTRTYTICAKALSFLPMAFIRVLLRLGKCVFLSEITTQRAFWNAYLDEVIGTLSKDDYISRMHVWIDLNQNYTFTPDERLSQPGKVLIIEADNDPLFPVDEREVLKVLYPQAQIHTFHSTGHFINSAMLEEYLRILTHFLKDNALSNTQSLGELTEV